MDITYRTPGGHEAFFNTEEMDIEKALNIAEDLERTNRAKHITFIDRYETSWTKKELTQYLKELETEPHNVVIYFDGSFDLETNQSGLGCVIYYDQNGSSFRLRKNALIDGLDNNNESEYAALHLALEAAEQLGIDHLDVWIKGDSKVVINQLNDEWPCLEESLSKWIDRIEDKIDQLGIVPSYEYVSRKKNREADRLAAQAVQEVEVSSTVTLD